MHIYLHIPPSLKLFCLNLVSCEDQKTDTGKNIYENLS